MTINSRIKTIRKYLNLNQEEFGKKINVTRSAISNYEKGLRNIMDRVILDICREFNVNEEWLRYGTGEMFIENVTFSVDDYIRENGATDFEINIIKAWFKIPGESRSSIINQLKNELNKT